MTLQSYTNVKHDSKCLARKWTYNYPYCTCEVYKI